MDPTGGEHGDLELNIYGRTTPWFRSHRRHKVYLRIDMTLGLSSESLDTPNNRLLLRFVFGSSKRVLDLGLGRVLRYGYLENDVRGVQLIREVGNHLQVDGHPAKRENSGISKHGKKS